MYRPIKSRILVFAFCLLALRPLQASVFDDWFRAHLDASAAKKLPVQTQSVSVDHGSTTFVDQSSGSSLVSTALNLTPVASGSSSQNGSGTVSASLYSVYALATRQDPLAPSLFNRHASFLLREGTITLGREQPDTSGGKTTPAGVIYGAKWMVFNARDATKIAQDANAMTKLAGLLAAHASAEAPAAAGLARILVAARPSAMTATEYLNTLTSTDKVDAAIAKLTPADRAQVDQVVREYRAAIERVADINTFVAVLQRKPQISIDFQTTQRAETLSDDYRLQAIYDQGIADRWSATVNASYDYMNSHKIGGDVRSGRGAAELRYNLVQVSGYSLRSPLRLALSGEGTRKESGWDYRGQLQLLIPISTGVNLPVSFGYAKQRSVLLMQEKGVYGKFGLTLDLAKIVDGLKNAL